MSKIKKELAELADSLEFSLEDSELEKIELEYIHIKKKLDLIKKIDTSKIEATNFVNDIIVDPIMREDISNTYNINDVFSNCELLKDGYVVIKNEK